MTNKILAIAALFLLIASSANAQTCYALVFDSGADLGAYQAGVFQGLVQNLPPSEVGYDVITGVGVGAVNAAFIGQYPIGQEQQAAQELVSLWDQTYQNEVYTTWFGGILQGLLFEPAIYNSAPLQATLEAYITDTLVRKVNVGAVNVNTEQYVSFLAETYSVNDLITILMAATAKPMVFSYVAFQNSTWLDGSIIQSFDLDGAIARCLAVTSNLSAITIDLVFTSNLTLNSWTVNQDAKVLDVLLRAVKISDQDTAFRQYSEAQALYPGINWRYVIYPSVPLPDSNFPFLFNNLEINLMVLQGIADAKSAVANQKEQKEKIDRLAFEKRLKTMGMKVTDENIERYKKAIISRDAKLKQMTQ